MNKIREHIDRYKQDNENIINSVTNLDLHETFIEAKLDEYILNKKRIQALLEIERIGKEK